MANNVNPPPSGQTFDWRQFKDWFFKLWNSFKNLTFGIDATSYSAAIAKTMASDGMIPIFYGGGITSITLGAGLLNIQMFTSGGTYNPTPGTTSIIVEVMGAGSGASSAPASGSGQSSSGFPGYSGSYARVYMKSVPSGVTVTVGTGGSGGTGGGAGSAGGTSSFGSFVSCPGGASISGGGTSSIVTTNSTAGPGSSAPTISNVTLTLTSFAGSGGFIVFGGGTSFASTQGGPSPLGMSYCTSGNNAGYNAQGYGAGGGCGGNYQANQPAESGGNGGNGVVIVYEMK